MVATSRPVSGALSFLSVGVQGAEARVLLEDSLGFNIDSNPISSILSTKPIFS